MSELDKNQKPDDPNATGVPAPSSIPPPVKPKNGTPNDALMKPAPPQTDAPGTPRTAAPSAAPVKREPAKVQSKAPDSKDPISRFRNQNTEPDDEARMGFIEHLLELRKRLWISIVAVVVCIVLALVFFERIYSFLTEPIQKINLKYLGPAGDFARNAGTLTRDQNVVQLTSTAPLSSMVMVIWLGFWGGLIVSSPIIFYQMWAFIAPGLRDHEKRAVMPVLYGGLFFFLSGAAIAYYLLAPVTFDFFVWLDLTLKNKLNYTSESYIDLLLWMMLVSGLLCEIPLLVAGMARMGVLDPKWLLKYWRGLTFGSIVLGTLVSPGNDLASMGVFAGLLLGIYFVSILMAFTFYRKPNRTA